MNHALVPKGFPLDYYKTYNETNYFMMSATDSTNYLTKIALTNQCAQEMKALNMFVNTLNKVTTNNLSPTVFASWYWSIRYDRAVTLEEDFEGDTEECLKRINEMSKEKFLFVSILDIVQLETFGKTWLGAELRIHPKNNPTDLGDLPIIYRKGKWRFIPGSEMP